MKGNSCHMPVIEPFVMSSSLCLIFVKKRKGRLFLETSIRKGKNRWSRMKRRWRWFDFIFHALSLTSSLLRVPSWVEHEVKLPFFPFSWLIKFSSWHLSPSCLIKDGIHCSSSSRIFLTRTFSSTAVLILWTMPFLWGNPHCHVHAFFVRNSYNCSLFFLPYLVHSHWSNKGIGKRLLWSMFRNTRVGNSTVSQLSEEMTHDWIEQRKSLVYQ